jgi:hypothetical protein
MVAYPETQDKRAARNLIVLIGAADQDAFQQIIALP